MLINDSLKTSIREGHEDCINSGTKTGQRDCILTSSRRGTMDERCDEIEECLSIFAGNHGCGLGRWSEVQGSKEETPRNSTA